MSKKNAAVKADKVINTDDDAAGEAIVEATQMVKNAPKSSVKGADEAAGEAIMEATKPSWKP